MVPGKHDVWYASELPDRVMLGPANLQPGAQRTPCCEQQQSRDEREEEPDAEPPATKHEADQPGYNPGHPFRDKQHVVREEQEEYDYEHARRQDDADQ